MGPVLEQEFLSTLAEYVGKEPLSPDMETLAAATAAWYAKEFPGVSMERWRQHISNTYELNQGRPALNYDGPGLREAVIAAGETPLPDLWPLFSELATLPTAMIHGMNSTLISPETVEEMQRCAPGLIVARVPDRGHVPFLDEPESLDALKRWIEALQ